MPLRTMRKINDKANRKRLNNGRFRFNDLISNLGLLPLDSYAGGGFTAKTCFFIPAEESAIPMFFTLAGSAQGVDLALRMPASLATENRAAQALDFVADFVRCSQSGRASQIP
ncbi:hypothetical protein FKG94_27150 [Exilibacterium tricleocarpae]|uniref:Uncharacterized protein n=1 Tax=Exilibacterium tricleocarpae TaxID=2591008 RepID=A0A545SNE8_9GAMM|nr:hypothetical protein [Exilibacterium tricleocarpae]TQV66512.1 hypothetical protein FKG94_27150 [Exilibacterium tricleocarpae]